ncbi:ileal sodium/bile acid cotransporter-like [Watersipora subatra]|uniref:ileal sodium/bile acid cotransporter-like n=1 Tax=Watersipora subatra TaxID=2589382 RepID=UPI00355BF6E3
MLAACLLPYGGYLLGGLAAWICRFNWSLIKTISIETGLQNTSVSILVAMSMSGQPDLDLAIILPIASTMVSAWPFYISLPFYMLYNKHMNKKKAKQLEDVEGSTMAVVDAKHALEAEGKINTACEESNDDLALENKL